MKGYGLILLILAVLLLLIPLPALPRRAAALTAPVPAAPTAAQSTTDSTGPSADTSTTPTQQEQPEQAVFRMLCGDEVVTLPQREFLFRTLAMEMPASYHEEALKAQAVAAYTYYHRRRLAQAEKADPELNGADFVTPNDQFPQEYTEEKLKNRWGSHYTTYRKKINDALDAVEGKVITYKGKLIDACFHAISNGTTEAADVVWGAEVPYLQAMASPGDRTAPGYQSECRLTPAQVKEALSGVKPAIQLSDDPATWFGKPTLSAAGTVETQPVGDQKLAGTKIRQLMGLRSAAFTITYEKEVFVFTVFGYGHGVGMSQYGADYLARQGYSYKEILAHYYTGTKVETLKE